jgi:hypothetical protein
LYLLILIFIFLFEMTAFAKIISHVFIYFSNHYFLLLLFMFIFGIFILIISVFISYGIFKNTEL